MLSETSICHANLLLGKILSERHKTPSYIMIKQQQPKVGDVGLDFWVEGGEGETR